MKVPCCVWLACSCVMLPAADKPAAPPVAAIYPSASTLPANHLKFYIHFREPMRQGVFLDHCKLHDERGREIAEPFRETELWSEDGRRLTLWLHPGRQKSGVNLNTDFGPVLAPGHRCTLVISGQWPTTNGTTSGINTKKDFFVGQRAIKQLDTSQWKILMPPAGSRQPVEVHLPTPLDHALLMRCLRVTDSQGNQLAGTVATTDFERHWRFTPDQTWTNQEHRLVVDTILEDLAGNSLARPFEVNLEENPRPKPPATIQLPFRPSGGS